MKALVKSLLLALLLTVIAGCEKDDDNNSNNNNNPSHNNDPAITFKANGTAYNFTTAGGSLLDFTSMGGEAILTINGNDGSALGAPATGSISLVISSSSMITTGKYDLSDEVTVGFIDVSDANNVLIYSSLGVNSGSINITSFDMQNRLLNGTFSAVLEFDQAGSSGNSGTKTLTITDGVINKISF